MNVVLVIIGFFVGGVFLSESGPEDHSSGNLYQYTSLSQQLLVR